MNIYIHELKANLKGIIMWILALSGLASVIMCLFPVINEDIDKFIKILDNFHPAMKAAFGMVTENFTSAIGFYSFTFVYSSLFGAIQAMNLGIGIISKEERERTADFLMTKPVSRSKILICKLMASLTIFTVTNVIYTIITAPLVAGMSESNFEAEKFALINCSLFILQLVFFSIGLIIAVAARKIKSVLPISLGLVFMFYTLSAFAVSSPDDKLRYITPFQYFKTDYILAEGRFETAYLITAAIIVTTAVAGSFILYNRRDIHAV